MQSRIIPRSLMALACLWALGAGSAGAAMIPGSLPECGKGEAALFGEAGETPTPGRQILWATLSPEQREQMRSQIREYWEQMPAEERQQRREQMRERRENMSPEARQQLRERIQAHRQKRQDKQPDAPP